MKIIKESKYTYLKGKYKTKSRIASILFGLGIVAIFIGSLSTNNILMAIGIASSISGAGIFFNALNYLRGIEGEKAVVKILQKLDDSYWLISDVLRNDKYGNIDHIVVSSKAIFVVETKNYSGDIRSYGNKWQKKLGYRTYRMSSVSGQAIANAHYVDNLIRARLGIRTSALPICVFTNPQVKLKLFKPQIPILRLKELVSFVDEEPPHNRFTDFEIKSICECILNGTNGSK